MRYLTALLARAKKASSPRAINVRQSKRRRLRLFVEQLEDRRLLATFTVINTDDSGAGSLRQAIVDANTILGNDTIQFDSGVNGTITLTSGELTITDSLDVQGPGSSVLAISGNNASRVFYVSADATISGLTISGGNSTTNGGGINNFATLTVDSSILDNNSALSGGGIFNWGILTLVNSTLSGNSAPVSNGAGGGIRNFGTMTVVSSTLSGNSASDAGGGIDNGGEMTVSNSTFQGNSASQSGGGIRNLYRLTVDNSTFIDNLAVFGAGINNWPNASATVDSSTFKANSAVYYGGGIYNRGPMIVDSTTFSGNSGGYSGAISNNGNGVLTVQNSTISGNSGTHEGGGIDNRQSATLTVVSSTLSLNHPIGILNNSLGTSTLNNSIVAANFDGNGTPNDIDGSVVTSSSHNLIGVDRNLIGISNGSNGNQVGTAALPINPMLGALQDNGGPTKTMAILPDSPAINAGNNSLILLGMTTDQRGTGYARIDSGIVDIGAYELVVANDPPSTFIVNTLADTVDANSAVTSLREAILAANAHLGADIIQFSSGLTGIITLMSGELAITNDSVDIQGPGASVITVSGNNASRIFFITANASIRGLTISGGSSTNGGGIYNAFGTLSVQNCTLSGNSVTAKGGGIYNAYGKLTVDDSILSGNSASQNGGGIFNANYGSISVLYNSVLSGNSTANEGGGIANSGTLFVDSSTIISNLAKNGGGIYNFGTLTVVNSTLSQNSVGDPGLIGFGGGIFNTGTLTVESSTFSSNSAGNSGGGIFNWADPIATIKNSTFSGNSARLYGGGILNQGSLNVDGSIFSGNSAVYGGGIYNDQNRSAIVQRSTLSGNSAINGIGGGIYNLSLMTVKDTTISGNTANYEGGGIANLSSGVLTLQNSTLSSNTASNGAGISSHGMLTVISSTISGNSFSGYGGGIFTRGTSTLHNTIIAANLDIYGSPYDIDGSVATSSSHNLIGVDRNLIGISHGVNGNQIGTAAMPINPTLGALQDNGGPTKTMAILPGSPAINAGNNSLIPFGVTTDQRGIGYARIDSSIVDIGAFERVLNRPPVANAGGPYSIGEGSSLSLDGSGSYDPDLLDTLTYSWDVNGDGVFGDVSGVSPTLTWAQLQMLGINDGPLTVANVRVRVDDSHAHVVDSPVTMLTVTNDAPVMAGSISGPATAVPGQSVSYSVAFTDFGTLDSHTVSINWGDGNITSGTVTETIGTGVGNAMGSHTYAGHGTYTITFTLSDDDLGVTTNSTSLAANQSIFVLHTIAAGAFTASGNGTVNVPGVVVVDSNSTTALTASGNVRLTASKFNVVGGIKVNGNAQVNGPVTNTFVPDPLAGLAPPALGTVLAAVSVSGNTTRNIDPGTYSSISVSGNGLLTLTPGVYVIAGGGFNVSGNGSVTGSGVSIVNSASTTGSTGSISFSGNGAFTLTPKASGPLTGILIFQPANNTKAMTINGNAAAGMNGTIYAPKAPLSITGNGYFTETIIVDRLTLSGNGSNLAAASVASPAATSNSASMVASTPKSVEGLSLTADDHSQLANIATIEETNGRDQLFASLATAPAKPGVRGSITVHKSKSDAREIIEPDDWNLLEGDFLRDIALARSKVK